MGRGTLVYVTIPDCAFCIDGGVLVSELAAEFGLAVVELPWESSEGKALVEQAGALFPPALFVDRRFLGYGRLSERRLRRELSRRAA